MKTACEKYMHFFVTCCYLKYFMYRVVHNGEKVKY